MRVGSGSRGRKDGAGAARARGRAAVCEGEKSVHEGLRHREAFEEHLRGRGMRPEARSRSWGHSKNYSLLLQSGENPVKGFKQRGASLL